MSFAKNVLSYQTFSRDISLRSSFGQFCCHGIVLFAGNDREFYAAAISIRLSSGSIRFSLRQLEFFSLTIMISPLRMT